MDKESTYPRERGSVTPVPARPPVAAPRAAAQGEDGSGPAASRLRSLDEVVRQVKVELERGRERHRGNDPYDSVLGRPNRDVWGSRRRA